VIFRLRPRLLTFDYEYEDDDDEDEYEDDDEDEYEDEDDEDDWVSLPLGEFLLKDGDAFPNEFFFTSGLRTMILRDLNFANARPRTTPPSR
jgi:hypothetical protein